MAISIRAPFDIVADLGKRVRVDAGQSLTSGQKTQARSNIGAVAVPASGDPVGSVPTKQSDGSVAYSVPSASAKAVADVVTS